MGVACSPPPSRGATLSSQESSTCGDVGGHRRSRFRGQGGLPDYLFRIAAVDGSNVLRQNGAGLVADLLHLSVSGKFSLISSLVAVLTFFSPPEVTKSLRALGS